MDPFRENLSTHAKLVDDLDALTSWATRKGLLDELSGDGELADIIEHLTEDIRFLI